MWKRCPDASLSGLPVDLGRNVSLSAIFWRVLIVAVSYDIESLNRRLLALEQIGHVVVPASSLESCLNALFNPFHLLIIGASVPENDRQEIAKQSKRLRPAAQIVSVESLAAHRLELADVWVPAGDEQKLIEAVKCLRPFAC